MTDRPLHHDALDLQVNSTLQGSFTGLFLTELFQGSGQLALFLLLLEAVSEWPHIFSKPDVYVLIVVALGQSAWLAGCRLHNLPLSVWSRLAGLIFYALIESWLEGVMFFFAPQHVTFAVLMLLYTLGAMLEEHSAMPQHTAVGIVLGRAAQGFGPILFYIALDLKGRPWAEVVMTFFDSAAHTFLLTLALTQVAALVSLTLVGRRQRRVIHDLLHQLKTLSRWGFGSRVVETVLRDSGTRAAVRVQRAIGFIDVRGFTAWSEAHTPEDVIGMLNVFYAAVLDACPPELIKSKMAGDEVLLVLEAHASACQSLQKVLDAALAAVQPFGLSAGAGLWMGPVVEGFFGASEAQIHDVIGDTVNTAKRLCDHARPGELLAGPVDWLDNPHQVEPASVAAKGKTQPIRAGRYVSRFAPVQKNI